MVSPLDFEAILAVAEQRGYVVEELSIGELAVKLSRRDVAPVTERKDKEEPAPKTALDMLNDPPRFEQGDVVTMPKGFETDTTLGPGVPKGFETDTTLGPGVQVQWATDDPAKEK